MWFDGFLGDNVLFVANCNQMRLHSGQQWSTWHLLARGRRLHAVEWREHSPACCQSVAQLAECLHCRCMGGDHKGPSFTLELQARNFPPHACTVGFVGGAPLAPDAGGPLNRLLLRNPAAQLDLRTDQLQHTRSTGVPRPVDGGATGSNSPHLSVGQSTCGAAGRPRQSGLQVRFGLGARHTRGCTPPTTPRAGSGRRRLAGSSSCSRAHTHAVVPSSRSSSHGGSHVPVSLMVSSPATGRARQQMPSTCWLCGLRLHRCRLPPPASTPLPLELPQLDCLQDPGAGAAIRRGAYGASRLFGGPADGAGRAVGCLCSQHRVPTQHPPAGAGGGGPRQQRRRWAGGRPPPAPLWVST